MGFVIVLIRSKMAEESLILLDKKMLSMDLSALSEFALHVKVETSVVEGKGKLSVIRSIWRKIEDSVDALTVDDQIDDVDGLMATRALRHSREWKISMGKKDYKTKAT